MLGGDLAGLVTVRRDDDHLDFGRQDDGDPRATYAVLEIINGFSKVRHYRIDYDLERAVAAIRRHGLPQAFAEMVRQGRKLVWVLEQGASGAS